MNLLISRNTLRSVLSLLFVLALFLGCFASVGSSTAYAGQNTNEDELESLAAEIERLQRELERIKGGDQSQGGHTHNWIPATFTQPQTCTICGATEGAPAPESTFPTEEELKYLIQNSGYPTVSDKKIKLKLPDANAFLSTPYRAKVQASVRGGRIYVMPIPEAGNGNLGTINDETEVVIIAKKGGYLFFVAYDGQMGWNGDGFFRKIAASETARRDAPSSGTYSYRELVNKVVSYDQFVEIPEEYEVLDESVIRYVHGSHPNSSSGGMYLRRSPDKTNNSIRVLPPHTAVTVLAVRGSLKNSTGYAFVETPDGEYGWVNFQAATDIGLSETNDF